jgi:hypothetical protein
MIGTKFTTLESKKEYRVIEKHKMFEGVWRCYPANQEAPYKQPLIDCFSTDFIEDCLKQKENENSTVFR